MISNGEWLLGNSDLNQDERAALVQFVLIFKDIHDAMYETKAGDLVERNKNVYDALRDGRYSLMKNVDGIKKILQKINEREEEKKKEEDNK